MINPLSITPAQANFTQPKVSNDPNADQVADAKELKKAFSQFVGETFYGTMLKSMRQTVGEPAYFHGGQAEELFQGRLDQQLSADMASADGKDFATALFKNQFPAEAALLRETEQQPNSLAALDTLRRQ